MNKEIKLRTAINGYNKTDVEEYIDSIVRDYEKQVEEYKKRFEEAMKIVDEKDEKCYLLETKLAESKIKLDDYTEKEKKMQSSEDNVYQLLGNLEKTKAEIHEIREQKETLESEVALSNENLKSFSDNVEKLKFENTILKEENRILKSESTKETSSEFVESLEKAIAQNEVLSSEIEALKNEKNQLIDRINELDSIQQETSEESETIGDNINMSDPEETRELKHEILFVNDKVMRLENEILEKNRIIESLSEGKGIENIEAYRSTRQPQSNITLEVIEQAGTIISTAKEEAAKMVRSVSNMYYDVYIEVKNLNESIRDVDGMFSETSEKLERIMENIKEEGQIAPIERTVGINDEQ